MNVLNFKNKEDFNKLWNKETYNYVFVNSLVIMNPDKHCTWSKVSLKQIVLRFWDPSQFNLPKVLELVRLLVKVKS